MPVARTASICDIYIKATNAQGQEVSKLTRAAGGGFQPVTLSLVGLADTTLLNFPNLTYRWTTPTGQTALSGTGGAASKIGDYKVVVKSGNDSCEVFFTLSGTPCVVRDYSTATCQNISINAPTQGNTLSNLAVGDSFNAADYTVTVTEVSPQTPNGGFTGRGYVSVLLPMGVTQNVAVTFDNIAINDCYELVNGKIELVVDPNKQLLDVDDALGIIDDLKYKAQALLDAKAIGDTTQYNAILKDIEKDKVKLSSSNTINDETKDFVVNNINDLLLCERQTNSNTNKRIGAINCDAVVKNFIPNEYLEEPIIDESVQLGLKEYVADSEHWEDLTPEKMRDLCLDAGVKAKVLQNPKTAPYVNELFPVRIGVIFENAVLKSLDRPKNGASYPVQNPNLNPKSVIPDAIAESGTIQEKMVSEKKTRVYYWWPNGVFIDAKFTLRAEKRYISKGIIQKMKIKLRVF